MWSDANWCEVTVVHVWLHTRSVHQRSDEWSSCGSVPPWHGVTQVGPEQGFSGCEWAAAILVSAPGIRLWNHVLTKSLSVAARIALFKDVTVNKLISMDTVNREASLTADAVTEHDKSLDRDVSIVGVCLKRLCNRFMGCVTWKYERAHEMVFFSVEHWLSTVALVRSIFG